MIIRKAINSDLEQILNLYKQEYWFKEGYDKNFIDNLSENTYLLVADDDGKIVGTAQLDIIKTLAFGDQPYGVLEFVVVDKNIRRKGVGRKIFEEIDNICRKHNCESCMLTSTIYRTEAHLFYEEMGYVAAVRGFRKEYPEKIVTKREANKRLYKKLAQQNQ